MGKPQQTVASSGDVPQLGVDERVGENFAKAVKSFVGTVSATVANHVGSEKVIVDQQLAWQFVLNCQSTPMTAFAFLAYHGEKFGLIAAALRIERIPQKLCSDIGPLLFLEQATLFTKLLSLLCNLRLAVETGEKVSVAQASITQVIGLKHCRVVCSVAVESVRIGVQALRLSQIVGIAHNHGALVDLGVESAH
ncbi:MAG: hypothetical protein Q9218_005872 [Villophora microphyllina]